MERNARYHREYLLHLTVLLPLLFIVTLFRSYLGIEKHRINARSHSQQRDRIRVSRCLSAGWQSSLRFFIEYLANLRNYTKIARPRTYT